MISFSIDNNAAPLQMKLNRAALGHVGPVGLQAIPDLGDEAFDAYGAMMFVRKGDKLVRIMYMSCPCGTADVLAAGAHDCGGIVGAGLLRRVAREICSAGQQSALFQVG